MGIAATNWATFALNKAALRPIMELEVKKTSLIVKNDVYLLPLIYLSMDVPFWIIKMSQIDLATRVAATRNMYPASGVKTPGTIIRKMAHSRLRNTLSTATFSDDFLLFWK